MSFQAVFLVGGLGTRLEPLTKTTPKSLLPVRDRPFLDYLIDRASHHGARDILLIAGHLGAQIHDRYHGAARGEARISVLVEPEPSGTAGALRLAAPALRTEFLLANGDTYFEVPLADLMAPSSALTRLALRRVADVGRYGAVRLAADGRITAFAEKEAAGPGLANGGVYRIDKRVLERIPAGGACSLEHDVFPRLVVEHLIEGQVFEGCFIDIGIPEDLARADALLPPLMR